MKNNTTPALPLALLLGAAAPVGRRRGRRDDQGRLHGLPRQGQEDRRPVVQGHRRQVQGPADVVAKLSEKVRKGGSGVFGPVPMAPNPPDKISDADLKAAIELILKS